MQVDIIEDVLLKYKRYITRRLQSYRAAKFTRMTPAGINKNQFQIGRLEQELKQVQDALDLREKEQGGSNVSVDGSSHRRVP